MRIWVGIYVRLRIWGRGDVWRVVQMRRHLGFVMVLRAGVGKGKDCSGMVSVCGCKSRCGKRKRQRELEMVEPRWGFARGHLKTD